MQRGLRTGGASDLSQVPAQHLPALLGLKHTFSALVVGGRLPGLLEQGPFSVVSTSLGIFKGRKPRLESRTPN